MLQIQTTVACEFGPDSSWSWSEEMLISRASYIFRATVVSSSTNPESANTDYKFKVAEIVKTPVGIDLDFSQDLVLPDMADPRFEWESDRSRGRATHKKDCSIWTNFKVNSEYLLFLELKKGRAGYAIMSHPKSVEELPGSTENPWYKKVKAAPYGGLKKVSTSMNEVQQHKDLKVFLKVIKNSSGQDELVFEIQNNHTSHMYPTTAPGVNYNKIILVFSNNTMNEVQSWKDFNESPFAVKPRGGTQKWNFNLAEFIKWQAPTQIGLIEVYWKSNDAKSNSIWINRFQDNFEVLNSAQLKDVKLPQRMPCKKVSDCKVSVNNDPGCCPNVFFDPLGKAQAGMVFRESKSCSVKEVGCSGPILRFASGIQCVDSRCIFSDSVDSGSDCKKGFGLLDACSALGK